MACWQVRALYLADADTRLAGKEFISLIFTQ